MIAGASMNTAAASPNSCIDDDLFFSTSAKRCLSEKYLSNSPATVSALRVDIQENLDTPRMASTLWSPPRVCHRDRSAVLGTAGYVFSDSISLVNFGGSGGGGGGVFAASALWPPPPVALAMSVSEELCLFIPLLYSQQGNTR